MLKTFTFAMLLSTVPCAQGAAVFDCTQGQCREILTQEQESARRSAGITLRQGASSGDLKVSTRSIQKERAPRIVVKEGRSYSCATENGVEKCAVRRKFGAEGN